MTPDLGSGTDPFVHPTGPRALTIAGVAMVNTVPQLAANEAPLLVEEPATSLPEA